MEWEYAARAGDTKPLYGFVNQVAWFDDNSEKQTHEVAQKQPNAWGLYDMLGNVWEWTEDFYGGQIGSDAINAVDPLNKTPLSAFHNEHVVRGASWLDPRDNVKASTVMWFKPQVRDSIIGFRCASK
jgi:formylglycine-generating enzyme required for sulfatase activity